MPYSIYMKICTTRSVQVEGTNNNQIDSMVVETEKKIETRIQLIRTESHHRVAPGGFVQIVSCGLGALPLFVPSHEKESIFFSTCNKPIGTLSQYSIEFGSIRLSHSQALAYSLSHGFTQSSYKLTINKHKTMNLKQL